MNLNVFLSYLQNYMTDLFGGPKFIKARYVANFFKGGTLFYLIFLMIYFDNYSLGAILYSIQHSSYGILWLLKVQYIYSQNYTLLINFFLTACFPNFYYFLYYKFILKFRCFPPFLFCLLYNCYNLY